MEILKEMLKK